MCETYNGWRNRETWALYLWLENDRGLYNMVRERVADDPDKWTTLLRQRAAGEAVKDFWEELTDPDEQLLTVETILEMVRDVGSEYRVDWDEIGKAWLDDLSEGGE